MEFVLALLAVFAPMGFPSTLPCCHVAVKPTICDMLLNHEKLGTDTLLPTPPSESREYSLGSLMHTGFVCCSFSVSSEHSVSTREFEESSRNSLTVTKHWPSRSLDYTFAFPSSSSGSPLDSEFRECSGKSLIPGELCLSPLLTVTFTSPMFSSACFFREF